MDSTLDIDSVVRLVLEQAQSAVGADGAFFYLREGDELVCRGASGVALVGLGFRLDLHGSLSGRCLIENAPLVTADAQCDERVSPRVGALVSARSAVVRPIPMTTGQAVLGVCSVRPAAFGASHVEILVHWAALLGGLLHAPAADDAPSRLSALQRSDERFRAFMDHGPAVAWMKDAQGRYLYGNTLFERLHQMPAVGVRGLRDEDFLPTAVARALGENDRRVLETGAPLETIEEVPGADGSLRSWLTFKFPVSGQGSPIVGGVAIDITERRRMEAELEDDLHRLEFIIDTQRELSMLDVEALTVVALERAQAITRATGAVIESDQGEELVYAHVSGCLTGALGARIRKEGSLAGLCIAQAELLYSSDSERDPRTNAAACRKQGVRSLAVVPIYADQRVTGVLKVVSPSINAFSTGDLRALELMGAAVGAALSRAEVQRARALVAQANSRLAAIVESSADAIFGSTHDGIVTSWNAGAERLFGCSAGDAIGRSMLRFVPEDRVVEVEELRRRTLQGDALPEQETVRRRADGTLIEISLSLSPVRGADGVLAIAAIARDVTERKRAERQLHASLREKEVLLREIHHRVKNNLQVISSLLGMQAKNTEGRSIGELIRESQQRVRSIAVFHDKLYSLKNLGQIDIGDYLRDLADGVIRAHGAEGRVRVSVAVDDTSFGVDRAIPCGLIVNELVTNALKHAFPKHTGAIAVSLRASGHQVTLSVVDDGVGLPEGLDPETSRGAGMQIVTTLAQQLGGALRITRSPGTCFSISFPTTMAVA